MNPKTYLILGLAMILLSEVLFIWHSQIQKNFLRYQADHIKLMNQNILRLKETENRLYDVIEAQREALKCCQQNEPGYELLFRE